MTSLCLWSGSVLMIPGLFFCPVRWKPNLCVVSGLASLHSLGAGRSTMSLCLLPLLAPSACSLCSHGELTTGGVPGKVVTWSLRGDQQP